MKCYICEDGKYINNYTYVCKKCLISIEKYEARSTETLCHKNEQIRVLYRELNKSENERMGQEKPYINQ